MSDEEAQRIVETVHKPVLRELMRRGIRFSGCLYAGLMLTATGPRVLKDREHDEAVADADFDGTLHLPGHVKELTTVGRADFDGRQAFKVHVVLANGVEQDEYFDTQSGLEIGWEAKRSTPLGVVPTTAILRDYKKFGALMHPTTLVQKALFVEQVLHITSVEYNVVPANTFEPPAAIKALLKDRKSTRLNSSHVSESRMPSSA